VSAGAVLPRERLDHMIQAYYQARGWDRDGKVSTDLIEALQLEDLNHCYA
jgi:aldehyde:ferredoxin oxidoreductase